MANYTVTFDSVPGMYAQYDDVKRTVNAVDEEEAVDKAHNKLRDVFPDRSRSMWRVTDIKRNF